jgi:hypothetical protein
MVTPTRVSPLFYFPLPSSLSLSLFPPSLFLQSDVPQFIQLICGRFIPLPKSDTKERIIANFDVFGFELSEEQMGELNGLDKDEHVCLNPTECP